MAQVRPVIGVQVVVRVGDVVVLKVDTQTAVAGDAVPQEPVTGAVVSADAIEAVVGDDVAFTCVLTSDQVVGRTTDDTNPVQTVTARRGAIGEHADPVALDDVIRAWRVG